MKSYPEKIPDPVKLEIAAKFHFRCGRCHAKHPSMDGQWNKFPETWAVHEIETRGAEGQKALRDDNRILLCGTCHEWSHRVGTLNSRAILIACRLKVLNNGKKTKGSKS